MNTDRYPAIITYYGKNFWSLLRKLVLEQCSLYANLSYHKHLPLCIKQQMQMCAFALWLIAKIPIIKF